MERRLLKLFVRKTEGPKKLPGVIKLLAGSIKFYAANLRRLILVVAVVSLPFGVMSIVSGDDPTIRLYGSLAAIFMNLALFWTVTELGSDRKPSLKESYYRGTTSIVRFIVFTAIIATQLLPFVIGAGLFNSAAAAATNPATMPERILIGILWLLFSLPSAYWFTQSVFGYFAVAESGTLPLQAVRQSREMVRGRTWQVLGRLLGLGVIMLAIVSIPMVLIIIKTGNNAAPWLQAEQLAAGLVLLPVSYGYLYLLRKALQ